MYSSSVKEDIDHMLEEDAAKLPSRNRNVDRLYDIAEDPMLTYQQKRIKLQDKARIIQSELKKVKKIEHMEVQDQPAYGGFRHGYAHVQRTLTKSKWLLKPIYEGGVVTTRHSDYVSPNTVHADAVDNPQNFGLRYNTRYDPSHTAGEPMEKADSKAAEAAWKAHFVPPKAKKALPKRKSLLGTEKIRNILLQSKKIQLSYSLVEAGRATTPPLGDFSDLLKVFPTTLDVMVTPPFLIIRVLEIPPQPWPLTIAGLPVDFTTEELGGSFQRGRIGRGLRVLENLDLHSKIDYSPDVLRRAILAFRDLKLMIRDIFWFGGFWQITVPDDLDMDQLPTSIARSPAFYLKRSEALDPDLAVLRTKPLQGTDYDDANYTDSPDAVLRPGIMLSSSQSEGGYSTTTSGVLVTNEKGELFITVATDGFEADGLVYHPSPKGTLIGNVVKNLPDMGISLVKLKAGLHYINETFSATGVQREGTKINEICPDYHPHLKVYDSLTMDNPYTGRSEGVVLAVGARIKDLEAVKWTPHQ